jgi:hypothetical protein
MAKYYEVLVQMKIESESGKGEVRIKRVTECYLVDAMSVTEAEARVVKSFSESGFSQDYSVVSVKGSKIIDVITAEEKPKKDSGWINVKKSDSISFTTTKERYEE